MGRFRATLAERVVAVDEPAPGWHRATLRGEGDVEGWGAASVVAERLSAPDAGAESLVRLRHWIALDDGVLVVEGDLGTGGSGRYLVVGGTGAFTGAAGDGRQSVDRRLGTVSLRGSLVLSAART